MPDKGVRFLLPANLLIGCLVFSACKDTSGPARVATAIVIQPDGPTFALIGEVRQLKAIVIDADGDTITDIPISWSSSDTKVATLSSSGRLEARNAGHAIVHATAGAVADSMALIVVSFPSMPRHITIAPAQANLFPGDTITIAGIAVDSAGRPLGIVPTLFVSSDTSVISVETSGLVRARAPGSARVTAQLGTMTAQANLRVITSSATSCDAAGGLNHSGGVADETWRRADSPHRFGSIYLMGRLVIEPGSLLCGSAGAAFTYQGSQGSVARGALIALGTAALPIVITAANPNAEWGGITTPEAIWPEAPIQLKNVRIENAAKGIGGYGRAIVDSTVFRRIGGSAISFSYYAAGTSISNTLIDTAGDSDVPAVFADVGRYENVIIRGARAVGLELYRYGSISLLGVRIEGSGTVGMVSYPYAPGARVVAARPVRIVGSGSYPVRMRGETFESIWPNRADQDSLLGNARDTLVLHGAFTKGEATARADLPWFLIDLLVTGFAVQSGARLTIEPGASITGEWSSAGTVTAIGTPTAPIRLSGELNLRGAVSDTSRLSNIRLRGLLFTMESHPAILDGMQTDSGSTIALRSSGSVLRNSTITAGRAGTLHYGNPSSSRMADAGLVLGAAGVRVERTRVQRATRDGILIETGGVSLSDCAVSESTRDGIRVLTGSNIVIRDCNLENNAQFGVINLGNSAVDARNNWWGSASGPAAPSGDGVSGLVDTMPFRTSPVPVPATSMRYSNTRARTFQSLPSPVSTSAK